MSQISSLSGCGVPWKMWLKQRAMPEEGNRSVKPSNYNMFKVLWYHYCFQWGLKYSNILIFFVNFLPNFLWKVFATFNVSSQGTSRCFICLVQDRGSSWKSVIHIVLDHLRNCVWDSVRHRNCVRLWLFTGFFKIQAAMWPGFYQFCCNNDLQHPHSSPKQVGWRGTTSSWELDTTTKPVGCNTFQVTEVPYLEMGQQLRTGNIFYSF